MLSPPQLHAVSFGPPDGGWSGDGGARYARLTRVLAHTAQQHCHGWDLHIEHRTAVPADLTSDMGNPSHVWNTQKLDTWHEAVRHAQDGDCLVLMDTDMAILRPLDRVWEMSFDIAYTVRKQVRYPLNGGFVALRVSYQTRAFVDLWVEINAHFLSHAAEHAKWRNKYAGINQASFGYVLEKNLHACHLQTLSCSEWNCENSEWKHFDPRITRVVHFKSELRRALFGIENRGDKAPQALVKLWKGLERQAMAAAMAVAS